MVAGVYDHCPAQSSGLAVGDVIVDVDGRPVTGLAQLFRTIWELGPAGVQVPMTVIHDNEPRAVVVQSVDRNERLRTHPLH